MNTIKEFRHMVSGLSKTYSIMGWRVGYVICDAKEDAVLDEACQRLESFGKKSQGNSFSI